MNYKEKVIILGATGSIGDTAIAELSKFRDRFEIVGISCNSNYKKLTNIANAFNITNISVEKYHPLFESNTKYNIKNIHISSEKNNIYNEKAYTILNNNIHCFYGKNSSCELIKNVECDTVIVAISGVDSIPPTIEAIKLGRKIILASKEVIVMCGSLIFDLCNKYGATILPLDSEHNAIFQCLTAGLCNNSKSLQQNYNRDTTFSMHENSGNCNNNENSFAKKYNNKALITNFSPENYKYIRSLLLTASGGRFCNRPIEEIKNATIDEVLDHPKWNMGKKITVDSSTMANKGLEVIEAKYLFNVSPKNIKVVIHPQCIIHSMVEFTDGSYLAQMSQVSMRYAMRYCLFFPERCNLLDTNINDNEKNDVVRNETLNFFKLRTLEFIEPDYKKFPCLKLAIDAANNGNCYEIAFNAANDIAVEKFLTNQIKFFEIYQYIENIIQNIHTTKLTSIDDCLSFYELIAKSYI